MRFLFIHALLLIIFSLTEVLDAEVTIELRSVFIDCDPHGKGVAIIVNSQIDHEKGTIVDGY